MRNLCTKSSCLLLMMIALAAVPAWAQAGGAIELTVDAREAPLKVLHVRMAMPASPGPLTLYYPKWIPGLHQPAGPVANLTGLRFQANGKSLPWRRDLRDVFSFHVDVPAGASRLEVSFDYLEPTAGGGPAAGSATAKWLVLNWYQVALYPAGVPASQLTYRPKLLLPAGWKFGTALPVMKESADGVEFQPVSLERFVDSPLIAGEYYRVFDLTPPGEAVHHEIDIVAESAEALAMPAEVQRGLTNLVAESGRLFGARHYREYRFLLTLSDRTGHFGVEHHESNDSRLPERVLLSPTPAREVGGLLAHEFAHSWSGKFRRPANQIVPDLQTPLETDLLWVYEGMTSFLGNLLAARSGLWTSEDYRQSLATSAASLGPGRPGRTWRPLLDTAAAVPGMFGGGGLGNWRRGSDYYEEGELLWLEVATTIHAQSGGRKSIVDFLQAFYGGGNRGAEVKPYTFEQLVENLNQVTPFRWTEFLRERLDSTAATAPQGGIEASGWKLEFTAEPVRGGRTTRGVSNTLYSLGMNLSADGAVTDTLYDGPAFKAGLRPGMRIAGLNGRVFSAERLADAITASKDALQTFQFLVIADDYYKTCTITYQGGPRYPRLVRDSTRPDHLADLVWPQARTP
jgi:predicted metalloprotease with PDZ domain